MNVTKLVRIGVAVAMVGAVVAALAIKLDVPNASPKTLFFGRFHILALHVPIGVLATALAAEACTFLEKRRQGADVVVGFTLPLLVFSGFVAIVLGLLLAHAGGYPDKLATTHRNLTVAGIVLASVTTLLWDRRWCAGRWIHRAALGATAAVLTAGAHFGGSLTHGADFLFPEKTPASVTPPDEDAGADAGPVVPVAADAGSDASGGDVDAGRDAGAAVATAVDAGPPPKPSNQKIVQGIVARRCNPCHTINQKGGLRISFANPSSMKKGAYVAGHPEASKLYTNLLLPMDDDDHMPPEKEAQLTKGEIAAFRAWIAESK